MFSRKRAEHVDRLVCSRARLACVFRDLLISARPVFGGERLLFRSHRCASDLRDGDDRTNKQQYARARAQYYCRRICRRRPRSDRGRRHQLHGRKYGAKSRSKQRLPAPRHHLVSCHRPNDGRGLAKNRGSPPAVKDLLKLRIQYIPLVRFDISVDAFRLRFQIYVILWWPNRLI